MDHNNGTPYAKDYIPEKHIQLTEKLVWCAHEKEEEHSMCSQKHEDDHKQHGTHGELLQDTCLEDEMRVEDLLNRLQQRQPMDKSGWAQMMKSKEYELFQ